MNEELLKLQKEQAQAFDAFKAAHKQEIETKGAEHTQKVKELNDKLSDLDAQIAQVKSAMNRAAQNQNSNGNHPDEKAAKYAEAFKNYVRKGVDFDAKAMSVNSDEDGGYLVTPEMSAEVIKKVYESSPIRMLASVQKISSDSLEILEDLDEIESGWVGETQPRGETSTAKLKMIKIPVHELFAQPLATQKLLDDAAINVEAWLSGKVAEKFARDEASAFVSGNGIGKPKGFLSYDNGTGFNQVEQSESAASGTITADDIIELNYKLKGAYKMNASFLAQRETIKIFRKFKDTQGRYLWEPGLNGEAQSTLLGAPVYEANDMEAYAGGKLAVAFGDIKQAYQIVDRIGIRVIRDVYSKKPFVLFYTTKRVGGAVKNFEAIKLLKVKA